jgi:hypothetical protein
MTTQMTIVQPINNTMIKKIINAGFLKSIDLDCQADIEDAKCLLIAMSNDDVDLSKKLEVDTLICDREYLDTLFDECLEVLSHPKIRHQFVQPKHYENPELAYDYITKRLQ